MSRLTFAIDQIIAARTYTEAILRQIPESDWFRQPAEGVTHVAWQVGHLAMAEYRLTLERLRGVLPADAELIPEHFLNLFAKDSMPDSDPGRYPPPAEIRAVFDAVHRQSLAELAAFPESGLDEPPLKPHRLFTTKFGAITWCCRHEMLHAGQLGLLRRLWGERPLW